MHKHNVERVNYVPFNSGSWTRSAVPNRLFVTIGPFQLAEQRRTDKRGGTEVISHANNTATTAYLTFV